MRLSRRSFLGHSVTGISALPVLASTTSLSAAAAGTKSMGEAKYVDVDGVRTRYFEGGSGDAMVLVHESHFGSTASSVRWIPIFPGLAANFHVYALDKLGMGLTDLPLDDSGYSMRATLDHIYRFIETLGIDNFHIAGHSRGALPSARIAMDHPKNVKTLTIFNSNTVAPGNPVRPPRELRPPGPPPTKASIRERLMSGDNTFNKGWITDEYVEGELEVASHPKIRQAAERFDFLRKRFIAENPEKVKARPGLASNSGTGWWQYRVKDETTEMFEAGRLKIPTQVLWGFNDPSATYTNAVEVFELISKSVDQAELHFFNRSNHFVFHDYPQEVIELMVSFIERVGD